MKIINVKPGDKYNRLTIISEYPVQISPCGLRYRLMNCKCDCGNKVKVRLGDLRKKKGKATESCGCYIKEKNRILNTTHGFSVKNRFYKIYRGILERCNSENSIHYKNYGGRGIKCNWKTFEDFKEDMYSSYELHKEKYSELNTTIDRIDNNGNYEKSNCKWATRQEQANNRRNNKIIEFNGVIKTVSQWSEYLNIDRSTLDNRIKRGWSIKRALGMN